REYIEAKFFHPHANPASRLPTIQEFSRHLKVSPSTVRSVFKVLAREGRLDAVPGRGTFLVHSSGADTPALHHCIGINAAEAPMEGWWGSIFLGVTGEALKENIMVTALGALRTADPSLTGVRKALDRVDGVIAFPDLGHAHEIDGICAENNLPVVHVNPTRFHATANFASNDYFGFAHHLALAWRGSGRRKIVLVMAAPVTESVSSAQTYSAFALAFASCPDARIEVLEDTRPAHRFSSVSMEMGRHLMKGHLEKQGPEEVDAVYCFGDLLAEGAMRELLQAGRSVPGDVSVVGGTGLKTVKHDSFHLVSMKQPMRTIGEAAAKMLIERIRNQSQDAPGIYLMPELGEGNTIRPEERAAFQRSLRQDRELL
ncbi:MAG: GntR family transcriptional regulator, partial [Chthoniobacterales bacterium]|nr:GntR family transcriptional regulator [Chthoniobacterales bacterium]